MTHPAAREEQNQSNPLTFNSIRRRLLFLTLGATLTGGMVAFFFANAIVPHPTGQNPLTQIPLDSLSFYRFAIFSGLAIVSISFVFNRQSRRLERWFNEMRADPQQAKQPEALRRLVLNWPILNALINGSAWLIIILYFSLFVDPDAFFRNLVVALFTVTVIFFGSEIILRKSLPIFFPRGDLHAAGGFRLSLQVRLLFVFLLVGVLPSTLSFFLFLNRVGLLQEAANPEAMLGNMVIAQAFITIFSLVASVALATFLTHALLDPISALQTGMQEVEAENFKSRVSVTSNDELGYLNERFNQMTEGLQQRERMRRLFGQYVSPEVARAAVESGAGLQAEVCLATVMFSDVRGFTRLSEDLSPEALVSLINRYMEAMIRPIQQLGGIVTRFGGDSIMAVFNTPLNPDPDHFIQALHAAREMRGALARFNEIQAANDEPELENGIGIATGRVLAGNVGGLERMEYTVMGDAANLASRLEDLTKELGYPILVHQEEIEAEQWAPAFGAVELPAVTVRGKSEPVTVYCLKPET